MRAYLKVQKLCFFILSLMVFAGCQSTENSTFQATQPLFYDQGFPQFSNESIETEKEIFHLDEQAKAFVQVNIEPAKNPIAQMERLVHAIFDRSEMNLLYRGDANTVANDTYHLRAANCLSMSIMTYALAIEAGFTVDFQEIMIPEYWTRRGGYSLLNGHINLKIRPPKDPNMYVFRPRSFQVDFDPQSNRRSLPKRIVTKQAVVAMFYNNKGADALLEKDYSAAYAYFREALTLSPNFNSAWINLGILYRLKGYFSEAEQTYKYALNNNPDSMTAWENLAYLYQFTSRQEEAKEIFSKVEKKRESNPYYHVNLGEEQIERENWEQALTHFRKALTLDKGKHEVYFGLARVYFEIGEVQQSQRYLKLAKTNALNRYDEDKYQNKLDFLRSL